MSDGWIRVEDGLPDRGGHVWVLTATCPREAAAAPDSRFDVVNGITLCRDCHRKLHGKGWKRRASREA